MTEPAVQEALQGQGAVQSPASVVRDQGDGHEAEEHDDPVHLANPELAHHFDTPQHQFDAGKLGIWLFLVTEVLFFAGLFCAYAIYRAQHPEIFNYAHYFLDTKLGAVNTIVLLFSSLTAAWAVRAAQLGQRRRLSALLAATIACAGIFLAVKYVEYSHKAHAGLLWGKNFAPTQEVWEVPAFRTKHPAAARLAGRLAAASTLKDDGAAFRRLVSQHAHDEPAMKPLVDAGIVGGGATVEGKEFGRPKRAPIFFGIYFFMTGLHGVHVIAGILVFSWLLKRSFSGVFGANYFGPVDFSALYWHLVDLIWIYLFPLLYLIH